MLNRAIFVFMGFVTAYAVIYSGDGLYNFASRNQNISQQGFLHLEVWFYSTVFIMFCVGVWYWARVFSAILESDSSKDAIAVHAFASLSSLGFLFGSLAAPFTNYGPYPWYWSSHWNFIMIIALIPCVFVLKDLITDVSSIRKSNVVQLQSGSRMRGGGC
jgi:hypothetical protein